MESKGQYSITACLVLLVLITVSASNGFAQQGTSLPQVTPPDERPTGLAPAADRRITVDVVVSDRSGKPVTGLQQQDFTILDNKQPQTIQSFGAVDRTSRAADRPLQAIVVVDAINTPYSSLASQRQQLGEFLHHEGGELPAPMSLVVLPDTPEGQTVVTRNGNTLADSLNSMQLGLRTHSRSQGYYGGTESRQISVNALGQIASYEATQPGRKLLVWLGPGWPLLEGAAVGLNSKDQGALFHIVVRLSTLLREARVTLYNINPPGMTGSLTSFYYENFLKGVDSANKIQNGNLALQVLAVQSGGRVLNASNDIAESIATCLADANAFYTLSFDAPPADHPNQHHNLQVKIGKPRLAARTRTGYYAQP